MPKRVTASDGDSLCSLAIRHGFRNCTRLRADEANARFLERQLRPGDVVTIPDLEPTEESGSTEEHHRFRRLGLPAASVRFVHGSPDLPYRDDATLPTLHISNFVTTRGGADGQQAFPSGFGFHVDGHEDPDAFKVEVEVRGGGSSLDVEVEPLRPVFRADGVLEGHEPFDTAERDARKLDVRCEAVSATTPHVYRSTYLRLVTDEADRASLPDQTVLVTDTADGLGGDADALEILDQRVRASFVVRSCEASAPHQCRHHAEAGVGDDPRRIRLAFHVFRTTPGTGAPVVGGLTEQMLRRRTFRWFRRAYAQASLAPQLVDPMIEFIDPPEANMLVLSQDHGRTASGASATGGRSELTLRLGLEPEPGIVGFVLGVLRPITDPRIRVELRADMTPLEIGQAVVAALPADHRGTASENARAFNARNGSCDVMITRLDGRRVMIYDEATTDTSLTVTVARVDLNSVASRSSSDTVIPATMDFRRVLRSVEGSDARLDCFVVGAFDRAGLRGRAFVAATDLAAPFQPPAPLRWAAVMGTTSASGAVMDASDNLPFTFPHEAGHVLCDAFHTDSNAAREPNGSTELMSGSGTSQNNGVTATKRICDGPYTVRYAAFDPAQPNPGDAHTVPVNAVQRFRARGASVLGGW